jgi:RecA/RadA recombinase
MSASHRKLSRLPLEVFENLLTRQEAFDPPRTPEILRSLICTRLKRFPIQSGNGVSTSARIKTIGDLFRTSERSLLVALDPLLTFEEIHIWLQRIYQQCSAKSHSALSLLQNTNQHLPQHSQDTSSMTLSSVFGDRIRYLPTGMDSLDQALQGGVRVGTVTELVGRAGAGKTQLAFQLCILAAKYNQGALYIDTERKIVLERLAEMSRHRLYQSGGGGVQQQQQNNNNNSDSSAFSYNDGAFSAPSQHDNNNNHNNQRSSSTHDAYSYKRPEQILANLTVETPASTDELLHTLDSVEEIILHRNQVASDNSLHKYPVRLLIVDSIAAPLKRDFGSDSAPQRSAAIFLCAQKLKRLAETLHLAVIAINQVGATASGTEPNNGDSTVSVRAALGTSWHHCVSTRLVLEHQVDPQQEANTFSSNIAYQQSMSGGLKEFGSNAMTRRRISVVKSNIAPFSTAYFEIDNRGIVDAASVESARGAMDSMEQIAPERQ